ncbi:KIR protein, partial [Plasmodium coatneyi]
AGSVALPSELIYKLLNEGIGCGIQGDAQKCCKHKGDNVKTVLKIWLKDDSDADEIERNYCYACAQRKSSGRDDTPCWFFYYWLGGKIKGKLDFHGLAEIMQKIYKQLPEGQCKNEFYSMCDDVGIDVFEQSKILSDCYYNYYALRGRADANTYPLCIKYNERQAEVKKAYDKLCNTCESSEDKYCIKFKTRHGTGNQCTSQGLPELPCKGVSETEPESMETITGALTKDKLKGASAGSAYQAFDFSWDLYNKSIPVRFGQGSLRSVLQRYLDVSSYADRVVGAWYYVSKVMNSQSPSYEERCTFFYFWLGDMLSNRLVGTNEFSGTISTIYTELQKFIPTKECSNIYTNINRNQFERRKKLFDHSKNYAAIGRLLKFYGNRCAVDFEQYLDDIFETYDNVKGECGNPGENYCKNFEREYEQYCHREASGLACDSGSGTLFAAESESPRQLPDSREEIEGGSQPSTGEEADAGVGGSGGVVPSVSGGLALVGIPTIFFFLYKVSTYNYNYNYNYKCTLKSI